MSEPMTGLPQQNPNTPLPNTSLRKLRNSVQDVYPSVRSKVYRIIQENRFSFFFEIGILVFTAIGILFTVVFFGMKFDAFTVRGSIDERNAFFTNAGDDASGDAGSDVSDDAGSGTGDETKIETRQAILNIQSAVRTHLKSVRKEIFPNTSFAWADSPEWNTLSTALIKDRETIRRAAGDAGISPRILVSIVIAEQLRFFTSDRESFKKFFEPLKVLGTMSEFSLGVSGVKQDTAKIIEQNLKNKSSPYYIGAEYENLLDAHVSNYSNQISNNSDQNGENADSIRFLRLTDSKDHYYSYLYTSLFARQIIEQWKREGYDLSYRPEILATLFNLGFDKSVPKLNPKMAGAEVTVGGETYTFGRLAYEFYYSGEIVDIFGF